LCLDPIIRSPRRNSLSKLRILSMSPYVCERGG
jgi:hypothetical protein